LSRLSAGISRGSYRGASKQLEVVLVYCCTLEQVKIAVNERIVSVKNFAYSERGLPKVVNHMVICEVTLTDW
jgi:hypothetical protein